MERLLEKFFMELLSMVHFQKGSLQQVSSKGTNAGSGAIQCFPWWLGWWDKAYIYEDDIKLGWLNYVERIELNASERAYPPLLCDSVGTSARDII